MAKLRQFQVAGDASIVDQEEREIEQRLMEERMRR
jgi:hypothetical protein